jgi:AcrR family transcriptional regulator
MSGRRARNARGEGAALRGEILQATSDLLAETPDPGAVSIRAVARRAGIAPTSVYLHFPDREAMLAAAVDEAFARLAATIRAAVSGCHGDARACLEAGTAAYLAFAAANPSHYRTAFGGVPVEPDSTSGMEAFAILVEGVRRCIADGLAPPDDAFRVATNVWVALHGLATLRASHPGFPWPDPTAQLHELLERLVGLARALPPPGEATAGRGGESG